MFVVQQWFEMSQNEQEKVVNSSKWKQRYLHYSGDAFISHQSH